MTQVVPESAVAALPVPKLDTTTSIINTSVRRLRVIIPFRAEGRQKQRLQE